MDKLLSTLLDKIGACPREALAVHCHDTGGRALANIDVALDKHNIRVVDSAVGGLGGCPYAGPGVPGNVSSEAVVSHLQQRGYSFTSPVDLEQLKAIGEWIRQELGRNAKENRSDPFN